MSIYRWQKTLVIKHTCWCPICFTVKLKITSWIGIFAKAPLCDTWTQRQMDEACNVQKSQWPVTYLFNAKSAFNPFCQVPKLTFEQRHKSVSKVIRVQPYLSPFPPPLPSFTQIIAMLWIVGYSQNLYLKGDAVKLHSEHYKSVRKLSQLRKMQKF